MNIKHFTLFLGLTLILFSCKKADDLTSFTIDNTVEFTIPASSIVNIPTAINPPSVVSTSDQKFEDNNTSADLVKDIKLQTALLTIKSPASETWNFLTSIEVYISAEGLDEILIAEKQNIPSDIGNQLELESTGAVLDDYIKKSSYSLRILTERNSETTQEIEAEASLTFKVRADLL